MTEADVVVVIRLMFLATVKIAAPPLIAMLAVGLLVSLLQAVTQISESTLSFLPKLAAMIAVVLVGGHAMLSALGSFAQQNFDRIVAIGGQ